MAAIVSRYTKVQPQYSGGDKSCQIDIPSPLRLMTHDFWHIVQHLQWLPLLTGMGLGISAIAIAHAIASQPLS